MSKKISGKNLENNSTSKIKKESTARFNFPFMDYIKPVALVAGLIVVAFLSVIMSKGFVYGIDFAGGIEMQVQFDKPVEVAKVRSFTEDMGYKGASVQAIGEDNEYLIRLESLKGANEKETNDMINAMIGKVTTGLGASFQESSPKVRRVDSVGPQIGDELKKNGLLSVLYSLLMILVYVGLRFDYKYAPGAVFCLFHDAIITLGVYALFGREVNVQTMAAILTIIGYSLNDTIVTFDRIRENREKYKHANFKELINISINETLSRTLLTSVTTLLAVLAMYFLAGGVIKDFAFTLAIGVVVGTFSSIYIASPLVLFADYIQNKKEGAKA